MYVFTHIYIFLSDLCFTVSVFTRHWEYTSPVYQALTVGLLFILNNICYESSYAYIKLFTNATVNTGNMLFRHDSSGPLFVVPHIRLTDLSIF